MCVSIDRKKLLPMRIRNSPSLYSQARIQIALSTEYEQCATEGYAR